MDTESKVETQGTKILLEFSDTVGQIKSKIRAQIGLADDVPLELIEVQ